MSLANMVNFETLVGPTHHHKTHPELIMAQAWQNPAISYPKKAALEGIEKMRVLSKLGVPQVVLPPHDFPNIQMLKKLGFSGKDKDIIERAKKEAPLLFEACYSSSLPFAINAATITPSIDNMDNRCHITPANQSTFFNRSIEIDLSTKIFHALFKNHIYFSLHDPIPYLADEGSLNHLQFCKHYGSPGFHVFIYGKYALRNNALEPRKYPAAQSWEAQEAVKQLHQIFPDRMMSLQLSPQAIDAGAFHASAVSLVNENVFLFHESAFVGGDAGIKELSHRLADICRTELIAIKITEQQLPLKEAIKSHFFSSQLVTLANKTMALVCSEECQNVSSASNMIDDILKDNGNPITEIHYVNLRNLTFGLHGLSETGFKGILTKEQLKAISANVVLTEDLYDQLVAWVEKYFRDQLSISELTDNQLLMENRAALSNLSEILCLDSIFLS